MRALVDKSFERDVAKISDTSILEKIADIIESIETCNKPQDIQNIKKLKGVSNYFRIRYKDFRLGIKIENDEVIFLRFLHRKDIYKYFP